jgi:carbonic anhydrase
MNDENDHMAALKSRLAQGLAQHQQWNKDNQELHDAAKNGQKPVMAIYHNGTIDPAALFGLPPAKAFCAGEFPLIIRNPDPAGDATLYPFLAAATFAKQLGVQQHVMVLSGNGPLRSYMHRREMGPLMGPWKEIWSAVVKEADAFAAQAGVTDSEEKYRLAALALLSRNAKILEPFVGKKITCCYLDMEKSTLEIYSGGDLADMWNSGRERKTGDLDLYAGRPRALACSCCDSRAGHGHLYCGQPGEFLDSNVIGVIVPPYQEIIKNKIAHPVWALAEYAYASGVREAVVTGHSQCGGVKALVNWRVHNESPGRFLDAWVGQATGVIDEVIGYAKKNNFLLKADGKINDDVYRLAEISVIQWSARNLEAYLKDRAQENAETYKEGSVLAHYLKIEERQVYVLNPHKGIDETYKAMPSLETLQKSLQNVVTASLSLPLRKTPRRDIRQLIQDCA